MTNEQQSDIKHPGLSPPESPFNFDVLSREQILLIGKAILKYRSPDSKEDPPPLERARAWHEQLAGHGLMHAFGDALGEYFRREPLSSIGWLIQSAQSGDDLGTRLLVHHIDAIATPPDEAGNPTPEMSVLFKALQALDRSDHEAGEAAGMTLTRLVTGGYLTESQHAEYLSEGR